MPLAWSVMICTWRDSGNMSGERRKVRSAAGSILRAAQCAAALSRIVEMLPRICSTGGTAAWYMENDMGSHPRWRGFVLREHGDGTLAWQAAVGRLGELRSTVGPSAAIRPAAN